MTVWNPFRRAVKSENERLRELEAAVSDLSDDVALCLQHSRRIDARLRQRVSRAAREAQEVVDDSEEVTTSSAHPTPSTSAPGSPSTKDQLRQLARQRGLLPM